MVYVSKRQKQAQKLISDQAVTVEEAVERIETFPKVKFDESIELHMALRIDPKASDQGVRGTVVLPHGTGKQKRIAVFCKGESEKVARDNGADHVGSQDLIDKVTNGFLDFDVVIASPDMMRDLGKLGKVLGPRGLMPTPKAGTVTNDIAKAINEVKAGKVEFKADKQAGIHISVGKRSFTKQKLVDNIKFILEAINHARPASLKVAFVKSAFISTTMGPSVRINV